ncbi:hypothetical protein VNO78_26655 [Psophocarpus tetragonolobus]|uniref:RING-type E3 ubiquitin transferase n=1 Tax=Psophocarpus tetragonolobus TaxID=3891 RepID=A0AAN9XA08_PSOTE
MNQIQQDSPNTGGVAPLAEVEWEENISLSIFLAATSENPSSGDILLQQGEITSAAVPVSSITDAAQGQQVQVHPDNNIVHIPAKRNYPEDVPGESHVGESSNMGDQAALAKRPATEFDHSTDNNTVNPSPPVTVTQQMSQFFSETPHTDETVRYDHEDAFVLPPWYQPSEPAQLLSRYMNINDRIRNARAIIYQHQIEQAGHSSSRDSQRMNYSGEASSSRTQNYHNQVQVSPSGIPPFIDYEPSSPLPQIPSAETRHPREELLFIDYSLLLDAFEMANPELFDAFMARNGLLVESIMQHMESETFMSADKEDPEDVENCTICLDEFENGDKLGKLHLCAHKFHAHCIKEWLVERNFCPLCKRKALNIANDVQNEPGAAAEAGADASEVNSEDGNA